MRLTSQRGRSLRATAQSIGGGAFAFTELEGWPVRLTGDAYEVIAEVEPQAEPAVRELLVRDGQVASMARQEREGRVLVHVRRLTAVDAAIQIQLEALPGVRRLWTAPPVFYPQRGQPLFASAAEIVDWAELLSVAGPVAWTGGAGLRGGAAGPAGERGHGRDGPPF